MTGRGAGGVVYEYVRFKEVPFPGMLWYILGYMGWPGKIPGNLLLTGPSFLMGFLSVILRPLQSILYTVANVLFPDMITSPTCFPRWQG